MVAIALAVALNVLALSERILCGSPLLAVNLFKHRTNVTADKSNTNSRCTALVTQHVKRQIHTLLLVDTPWFRMYTGPAKSTAALVNGGASLTRNAGRGGAGEPLRGFPSKHLHMTHL